MPVREKQLLGNAAWLLLLQAVNMLLPFITVPYVTRVFGADGFGVFSIALNWMMYFQLVVEFGFNLSATKRVAEQRRDMAALRSLLSAVVAARVALVIVCFGITLALGALGAATERQISCMFVLFAMLLGVSLQLNWLFQGLQDMKVITLATACARAVSVVLIFALIRSSDQLLLYSLLYSVTFVLSAAITHWQAWRKHGLRVGPTSVREVWTVLADGFPLFLSSAAGKVIGNVGVTVLGAFQSAAVVGSYAAVLKLPQMISLMFSPVGQALYPRVNQLMGNDPRRAVLLVGKAAAATLPVFGLCLLAVVALREPLVGLLFGADYVSGADMLIPLSAWVLLGIVNNFLGVQLLIPLGGQRFYSACMVVDAFAAVALCVALGAAFGGMGVASGVAASELALTVMLLVGLLRRSGWARGSVAQSKGRG